jgi:transposase-like protein
MRTRSFRRRRRRPPSLEQRAELLADFERCGKSAAAFAREHGIAYSTLCSWRQQGTEPGARPDFVEVELTQPPVELVVELGAHARLRISSVAQVELAARLLQQLSATKPC